MSSRQVLWIGLSAIVVVGIIVVSLVLTPQATNPAFDVATTFMNAAGVGDESTAFPLLNTAMQEWVGANCPDGQASACVQGYIPPEWGKLIKAVFRRAAPDGEQAWDVELIATYEKDTGASGVCSYFRMEQEADETWRIAGWAGFMWCGDARSRNMATNTETPNRAP